VLVAVGPFHVAKRTAGGVPVTVGVSPGLGDNAERLAGLHVTAMAAHAARFGPFPYASLDVAVVPDVRGGIEFPGGIILGPRQDTDATLVHEVAHEWFYGLVGDNQGRDPWLDESFATYAEALVRGTAGTYLRTPIASGGRNRVGAPMTYWEPRSGIYYRSVYVQGAAALLRARAAVGAAAFDRAIRCYVARSAHTVATPANLATALAGLPAAAAILRRAGALPPR
jgi:aminopeptidase N